MPSRRKRKRERRKAEATNANSSSQQESGGRGEEPYLTPVQQNKIISLLVHRDRQVWPVTDEHKQAAVDVTVQNLGNDNGRVSNAAVRNLLAMERQNMDQETQDHPQPQQHNHVLEMMRISEAGEPTIIDEG